MPGIVGIIGRGPPDKYQRLLRTMIGTMMHEPGYVSGAQVDPDLGVYAGWVAHEGSYAARQSMGSRDNDLSLAFAGECFPSAGDGEAANKEVDVLASYGDRGAAFVANLNGLFSGILIDRKRHSALLFNDRYAAERLYSHERGGALFFASEAKALLAVIPEIRSLDECGVAQFLAYGSTHADRTLFRDVRLLPGGCAWRFERDRAPVKALYFQPREWEAQPVLEEQEFERQFVDVARAVLPVYTQARAPVGISITGGLDTRMIIACLPSTGPKPVCYTFAGLTGQTLDVRIGRRVAQVAGLTHHTLRVSPDFVTNFGSYVDRTVFITDGCAGALTAHEVFLTALGRALAPIRLTGNFGSEVLRSMSTLKPRDLAPGLIASAFGPLMGDARVRDVESNPVTQAAFREVPLHLFGSLAAGRSQATFRTPYLDNALVRLAYRAPPAARNTPGAALRLIAAGNSALARIPTDRGQRLDGARLTTAVRRLFCEITFKLDYMDKEGLPGVLAPLAPVFGALSKTGLLGLHKFLPYRSWFRNELADYVSDVLGSSRAQEQPYWNRRFLGTLARDHRRGSKNYLLEISSVLTLEAVERLLLSDWKQNVSVERLQEVVA